jgi:molybdopterin/thiamine biosynthesis adenylyltransferase
MIVVGLSKTSEDKTIELTREQIAHYRRQLSLPGMSHDVQHKIFGASALVLGLRNAGALAAHLLANAGIKHLGLVDGHYIDAEDVIEQLSFGENDLGKDRGEVLQTTLRQRFNDLHIETFHRFDAHTADEIVSQFDIVMDDLDDWQEKLIASDACMEEERPLVHLGLMGFNFQVFTMLPGKSACLRCLFGELGMEDIPPDVSTKESFGPVIGMGASFQVTEAIKVLGRLGVTQPDELTQFDGLRRTFSSKQGLTPRPDCPDCGEI